MFLISKRGPRITGIPPQKRAWVQYRLMCFVEGKKNLLFSDEYLIFFREIGVLYSDENHCVFCGCFYPAQYLKY